MHFHLPKPLHGWRAFAGEVGIIVIGVLIALGAEQVVETIHWNREVGFERKALRDEGGGMLAAISERGLQQGCIDRRLGEIAALLDRHRDGLPLGMNAPVGLPVHVSGTRGSWPIALAGQTLLHMPQDEQLDYSYAYGAFDVWDRAIDYEYQDWLKLQELERPELMTETDWANARQAYFAAIEQ